MSNKYQYYIELYLDKFESEGLNKDELRDYVFKELSKKIDGLISYDFICTCCETSIGSDFNNYCSLCEEDKSNEKGLFYEVHLVITSDTEITKYLKFYMNNNDKLISRIKISKFESAQYDDGYQVLLTT